VIIYDDRVSIISKNLSSGMYDWGKNERHVEGFLKTFDDIQTSLTEKQ
jgi:hypothetical protein